MTTKKKAAAKKAPTCPCGRSPYPNCVGWHALTEDQYLKRLKEFEAKAASKKS